MARTRVARGRNRWVNGKSFSRDTAHSTRANALMRKMELEQIGNEVRVIKEGKRFLVLARAGND